MSQRKENLYIHSKFDPLKGAMSPLTKTNLKESARLFQVLSEILEGYFYRLNLSHRLIVSEVLY